MIAISSTNKLSKSLAAISTVVIALASSQAQAGNASENVTLMSHISLGEFTTNPGNGNDCWGYVSSSGREYALMGISNAMVVVEITNPQNPVIVEYINHSNSLWGDVKTYGDYCYVVNESGGGMDVVDLSDVDNGNVTLVQQVTIGGLSSSHNVAIDTDSGFLYICGGNINGGRLVAFDLTDPANPTLAGQMPSSDGVNVHDAQIVTYTDGPYAGLQIGFSSDGGAGFSIYDVTNKSNMFLISRVSYPNHSYTHQCWVSEDKQYVYLNDELDGINETVIFDVSDLANPTVAGSYNSGVASTDHNLYIKDGFIYEADYTAGLRIFDAADPLNPVQVGYFDSYIPNDAASFNGAWSVYPYFPSGLVIISDIDGGLYIVNPAAPPLAFSYPSPLPTQISPDGDSFLVQIDVAKGSVLDPGSPTLHYNDGGGFVKASMSAQGGSLYEATFGPTICGEMVEFYVSAQTMDAEEVTDPSTAPNATFATLSATDIIIAFEDDLEAAGSWLVGGGGDNATTGIWTRVDPNGTAAQPEDDHTIDPGTNCFVTGQGAPGGPLGENDVDGGQTTLRTPIIDLSGIDDAVISYWRWYSNNTGGAPNADIFVVDITNNNGSTWTNIETVGPSGSESNGGWFKHSFNVADFVAPTGDIRLRFIASDFGEGSLVEAAVDDFKVSIIQCDQGVFGDLDGDGVVSTVDLLIMFAQWGPCGDCKDCPADLDGDCTVSTTDLLLLFANWG